MSLRKFRSSIARKFPRVEALNRSEFEPEKPPAERNVSAGDFTITNGCELLPREQPVAPATDLRAGYYVRVYLVLCGISGDYKPYIYLPCVPTKMTELTARVRASLSRVGRVGELNRSLLSLAARYVALVRV